MTNDTMSIAAATLTGAILSKTTLPADRDAAAEAFLVYKRMFRRLSAYHDQSLADQGKAPKAELDEDF